MNEGVRGWLALLAACLVAFVAVMARKVPMWFSPSHAPLTLSWFVPVGGLLLFVFNSILLAVWVFPGCAVVRWVMLRRRVEGMRATAIVAGVSALVACGTLYFFPVMFGWPPAWQSIVRKIPAAIDCVLFVFTWFLTFEWLSRFAADRTAEPAEATVPTAALAQRASRTTVETLALAAVVSYAAIVGGIGGVFMDFGGEGDYRLNSTIESPSKTSTACLVGYYSPGGALGRTYTQVYLLKPAEHWTAKHRGLLVWQAKHVNVLGVNWATDRDLGVQVEQGSLRGHSQYVSAYPRSGFAVRTEPVPGP